MAAPTVNGSAKATEKKNFQDLGFGNKIPSGQTRLLNPDGTFNVERRGIPSHYALNGYQVLINVNWPLFILIVFMAYVFINILFSLIYLAAGVDNLVGRDGNSMIGNFWDAFFFSAQTLTTVGYGRIAPKGVLTSGIAAFESLTGLMGFAIASGLLYTRFARPRAQLLFSKHILISPYRDGTGLMFRMANARKNQLIDTEVQLSLSMAAADGTRQFFELTLERKMINFFPLSWTVVHPIEPGSPLYGMGPEAFAQTIFVRKSYGFSEVIHGAKFAFIFSRSETGATIIDLHRLDEFAPAVMPGQAQLEIKP